MQRVLLSRPAGRGISVRGATGVVLDSLRIVPLRERSNLALLESYEELVARVTTPVATTVSAASASASATASPPEIENGQFFESLFSESESADLIGGGVLQEDKHRMLQQIAHRVEQESGGKLDRTARKKTPKSDTELSATLKDIVFTSISQATSFLDISVSSGEAFREKSAVAFFTNVYLLCRRSGVALHSAEATTLSNGVQRLHNRCVYDLHCVLPVEAYGLLCGVYASLGDLVRGKQIFVDMERDGLNPSATAFIALGECFARNNEIDAAWTCHTFAGKHGGASDLHHFGGALLSSCTVLSQIHDFVAKIEEPHIKGLAVSRCVELSLHQEAIELFESISHHNGNPGREAVLAAMSAHSLSGDLIGVERVYATSLEAEDVECHSAFMRCCLRLCVRGKMSHEMLRERCDRAYSAATKVSGGSAKEGLPEVAHICQLLAVHAHLEDAAAAEALYRTLPTAVSRVRGVLVALSKCHTRCNNITRVNEINELLRGAS